MTITTAVIYMQAVRDFGQVLTEKHSNYGSAVTAKREKIDSIKTNMNESGVTDNRHSDVTSQQLDEAAEALQKAMEDQKAAYDEELE